MIQDREVRYNFILYMYYIEIAWNNISTKSLVCILVVPEGLPFLFPEAALLLNHDLWDGQTSEGHDSQTFWQIWLAKKTKWTLCSYACSGNWTLPYIAQCSDWGREWKVPWRDLEPKWNTCQWVKPREDIKLPVHVHVKVCFKF